MELTKIKFDKIYKAIVQKSYTNPKGYYVLEYYNDSKLPSRSFGIIYKFKKINKKNPMVEIVNIEFGPEEWKNFDKYVDKFIEKEALRWAISQDISWLYNK